MKTVYVAGPMRGYTEFNFPAFDRAASLGRSLGWEVVSPAEMDRENGVNEKGQDGKFVFPEEEIRVFIRRDVDIIINRMKAERGDAIALLPGWGQSVGARGELGLALWAKLTVLDARTFLPINVRLEGIQDTAPLPPQFRACGIGGDCSEGGDWGAADEMASMALIAEDFANRKEI